MLCNVLPWCGTALHIVLLCYVWHRIAAKSLGGTLPVRARTASNNGGIDILECSLRGVAGPICCYHVDFACQSALESLSAAHADALGLDPHGLHGGWSGAIARNRQPFRAITLQSGRSRQSGAHEVGVWNKSDRDCTRPRGLGVGNDAWRYPVLLSARS